MNLQEYPHYPILIIDDEKDILDSYKVILQSKNINNLILCSESSQVMNIINQNTLSLIILDLLMPGISGEILLDEIKKNFPHIPVIIITGNSSMECAIECIKKGAYDYLVKPVEKSKLLSTIYNVMEKDDLKNDLNNLKNHLLTPGIKNIKYFENIITNNPVMKSIFKYIEAISESTRQVLITGESGTGKELIAKAIHKCSNRKGKFIAVNVSGLDDTMFTDTLFGHLKGSFTTAKENRKGLIEEAEEGTIFLDEIGDLEISSQIKLLRLLQEKEYYPIGSDIAKTSNARIITATNIDLKEKMNKKYFRKDLYYRLNTHHIKLPPLRERYDDLTLLIDYFIEESSMELKKKRPKVPKEINDLLNIYSFPGNIRELQSMIFDAVSRHDSKILSLSFFRNYIKDHIEYKKNEKSKQILKNENSIISFTGEFPTLKDVELFFVKQAMKKAEGNQRVASLLLGISQPTLSRKVQEIKK